MSPDLLARLSEYARARNLTVSDVVRRAAEQLVAGAASAGLVYLTGTQVIGSGIVNTSPTSGGATQNRIAEEDAAQTTG